MNSPQLLLMVRKMAEFAARNPDEAPEEIKTILQPAKDVLRHVYDVASAPRQAAE